MQDKPHPPPEGRLPDATTKGGLFKLFNVFRLEASPAALMEADIQFACPDHLWVVFGEQMGLSDKDIVALSGGHTLVCILSTVAVDISK